MPTPTAMPPPEAAAAAIRALLWVQDDMATLERSIVGHLETLAARAPEVFWELMRKPWMEETQEDTHGTELLVIAALTDMAVQTSETAALQTIKTPFLETIELGDFASMEILNYLVGLDPDGFQQLLSHPTLNGDATDSQEKSVALLYLELRDPDAAVAMGNMLWVQDGITYSNPGKEYGHIEQEMVVQLFSMALYHRQVFWDLVHKPWMQDALTEPESQAITRLSAIANPDEAAALQIIGMPFLDSMDRGDSTILENLRALEGEGLHWLLSHATLTGGITDDQRATVALLRLEWQYPETAAVIMALPWVRDGIAPSEVESAMALQELALDSERLLQALTQKSWVQRDGLTPDESSVIWSLRSVRDEAVALRIVDMPFLETIDVIDAAAMDGLGYLSLGPDQGYFEQVLSHPTLRDGITDDQAVVVTALQRVDVTYRPELLDTLLDPEQVTVEKRVIYLPHAGEVTLSVIHVIPGTYRTMDILEQMVRLEEGFMALPFPERSYVGLLVADATPDGGAGGSSGLITLDPLYAEDDQAIAHEVAHIYWPFFPRWIAEGAAELTTAVLAGTILYFSSNECSFVDNVVNLSDLDRLDREHIESGLSEDDIYWSSCYYALGGGLFLDLYETLGEESFRRGFGRLYLAMRGEEHDDECTGLERGVCYVRAAFVTDALPESAALAEPVIAHWYYGPTPEPTATPTPTPTHTPEPTPIPGSHAAINAMPWLGDGITRWEELAAGSLRAISSVHAEAAALMLTFPWIMDGITAGESSAISGVRDIMDEDPELAKEVLGLWWVPDDMPTVEQYALGDLRDLARRNLVLARQAIGEPFMGPPFRQRDEYALNVLSQLALDPPGSTRGADLLAQLAAEAWFSDGLDDLETALLHAIVFSAKDFEQALIETHYVASVPVTLPLAGDVELVVVRHTPFSPDDHTFATLEEGVRAIEGFMGAPFPVGDVILLLAEPDIWSVGAKLVSHVSGGVEAAYITALILANNSEYGPSKGALYHEIGHHYHLQGPEWLTEGVAQFLETYTLAQTGGEELEQRLADLESSGGCGRENIQQHIDDDGGDKCDYDLGEKFLLAMYAALGPEAVSAALSDLYTQSLFFEYLNEDIIYQAFLSSVPPGKEEAFKTAYRRYHGGPIVDAVLADAPDLPPLVALYNATNGADWVNTENWMSNSPLGTWHGVATELWGRVRILDLEENGLAGEIPPELGSLSDLRNLFLAVNSLVGEIPPELGSLSKLIWLRLGRNQLSGEIPRELGNLPNLQALELWENQLTGDIPSELAGMSSMRILDLQVNQLTGEIPPELADLTNLESFATFEKPVKWGNTRRIGRTL